MGREAIGTEGTRNGEEEGESGVKKELILKGHGEREREGGVKGESREGKKCLLTGHGRENWGREGMGIY